MSRSARSLRFLWPLSILYSAISRTRSWCYKRGIFRTRKLPGTVISVGNLTMGGTGKTPMVLWMAETLAQDGKRIAVLTRGYRGSIDSQSRGLPQSDEVALMRERLSGKAQIGVGADRYKNGEALARHGTDWFVLDDGFQHLALARDVDIVLIDATDPFGGGRLLPAGRLREPVSALRRADIVVITRSMESSAPAIEAIIRRHTKVPVFYARTQLENVLRVPQLVVALPSHDWGVARFMAFCGIGNSEAFFDDLRAWGIQVVAAKSFADHHVYTAREVSDLELEAAIAGADALLCTEKDVWNLRNTVFAAVPVYCCRISLQLPDDFRDALSDVLLRKQADSSR